MRENEQGQFYSLYVTYMQESRKRLLELMHSPTGRELLLSEDEWLLQKNIFYQRLDEMTEEVREGFLRNIVGGYALASKGYEARYAQCKDENPIEEAESAAEIGTRIAQNMVGAWRRNFRNRR